MTDIKQGFVLGFFWGLVAAVILVWLFKHKLAKYYAKTYGSQFGEAVEAGVEAFIGKF